MDREISLYKVLCASGGCHQVIGLQKVPDLSQQNVVGDKIGNLMTKWELK